MGMIDEGGGRSGTGLEDDRLDDEIGGEGEPMRIEDLRGKAVVSMAEGRKVGEVSDLAIDPGTLRIAALIMTKGGMFNKDVEGIPADQVQVWGQDAILVQNAEVIYRGNDWPEDRRRWLHALDRIKGLSVVSSDGKRLGQVDDVYIDRSGALAGFTLGQGFLSNASLGNNPQDARAQYIDAQSVRTLGQDVVIVDVEAMQPPASRLDEDEVDAGEPDDVQRRSSGGVRTYPSTPRPADRDRS